MRFGHRLIFVVLLIVLTALLCLHTVLPRRGTVDSLQRLPVFGKWLPTVDNLSITYEYNPLKSWLNARFFCDTNVFHMICQANQLSVVRYGSGFRKDYLIGRNAEFMPDGERVWCALGMLNPPGGRRTIELAYEPSSGREVTNQTGMLYMSLQ